MSRLIDNQCLKIDPPHWRDGGWNQGLQVFPADVSEHSSSRPNFPLNLSALFGFATSRPDWQRIFELKTTKQESHQLFISLTHPPPLLKIPHLGLVCSPPPPAQDVERSPPSKTCSLWRVHAHLNLRDLFTLWAVGFVIVSCDSFPWDNRKYTRY